MPDSNICLSYLPFSLQVNYQGMKAKAIKIQSLTWPVLFFIAGIVTSLFGVISDWVHILTFIIGASCGAILLLKLFWNLTIYPLRYLLCLILFYTTGWGITTLQENQYNKHTKALSENSTPAGRVINISHFPKMDRLQVRVPASNWWSPSCYFNINLLDKNHHIRKGQTIVLSRALDPITSSHNPYTFQAKEYWDLMNTSHDIFLQDTIDIRVIQNHPISLIEKFRQKVEKRIDDLYPDDSQAGIIKALLLGKKEGVSKADINDFKNAGLMHILAVSGLHVGIVSSLLFILLLPVKLIFPHSRLHFFLVTSALWVYAGLTGMNTPVVRAVILISFYLTARQVDRQIDKWNIFFWAVLLILAIHPKTLLTVSFQLSFGAVAAILLFYSEFQDRVTPFLGQNYFSGLVAVSLAAQIGIFPLLLFHFQEISMVSTLSSFLVIPLLFPLILLSSFSLIPFSWEWLSGSLSNISQVIIDLISGLSGMLAGWEFSSQVIVWSPATIILLLIALLIGGLYLESRKQNATKWLVHASWVCLLFAIVNEGLNIYLTRNQAVLAIYENRDDPITDFYYRGVCYTNSNDTSAPFLIRNRKKHYAKYTVTFTKENEWNDLIQEVSKYSQLAFSSRKASIKIIDYIKNENNIVEFQKQNKEELTNTYYGVFPIRALYNTE